MGLYSGSAIFVPSLIMVQNTDTHHSPSQNDTSNLWQLSISSTPYVSIWYYYTITYNYISYKFGKTPVKKIKRDVDIPYISDTRQINELYKAVFWYLTHNEEIDYLKLTPAKRKKIDKSISSKNEEFNVSDNIEDGGQF